jgi:molybdopterin-containing oxidoreductase family iron-sulfur binding subunit
MNKYWKSLEELKPDLKENSLPSKKSALFGDLSTHDGGNSRRDFLKFFGFSIASTAVLASCARPVKKAIPLLVQPEEIKPGTANYYATTFYDGGEIVPVLAKVRDGRPIKIEGNDLYKETGGAASARVQAALLNLYDESRPQNPLIEGKKADWESALTFLQEKLDNWEAAQKLVLLTPTITGPSTIALIEDLIKKYPFIEHLVFDSISYSAIRKAHQKLYDLPVIPSYNFDKANVIVGFNCDFLGTWLQPLVFAKQYAQGRRLSDGQNEMSRHIQFESLLTLTGSNADTRFVIQPSEEAFYLAALYHAIARKLGVESSVSGDVPESIEATAKELFQSKGKSLVVSGTNNIDIQVMVCAINHLLNNVQHTVDLSKELPMYQGDDEQLFQLIEEMSDRKVGGILFYGTNPVYHLGQQQGFKEALEKVPFKVACHNQETETAAVCNLVLPEPHFLEAWGDHQAGSISFSLVQPVIRPLFETKQFQEIVMHLTGQTGTYYDYLKNHWQSNIFVKSTSSVKDPLWWWKKTLQAGLVELKAESRTSLPEYQKEMALNILANHSKKVPGQELELMCYQKVSMGDGTLANNPWLQEMPDPVTKVCWDNYLSVAPAYASLRGWVQGDVVTVSNMTLPVLIQPGQSTNTLGVALGYGRTKAGKVATGIGADAFNEVVYTKGCRTYTVKAGECVAEGASYELASTQSHHDLNSEQRKERLLRETTLAEYLENPASGNEMHAEVEKLHTTLYKKHEYKGHHWGMAVDLTSCIGCNACVVACNAENNVPVVGRNEVRRAHEMHWLRIDRYYHGDETNPEVLRQPVMCQHCDNAPCENVCPVAATNHSFEGINQMAYNRCIGTRYCNNNCPYKVRRFNWFDYTGADTIPNNRVDPAGMTLDLKRMVLNPDVTVRAKGVIEKCSFCIQRIQEKKLEAKRDGRPLEDGEIKTACQQTCPTDAIVFGDMNDPNSKVSKLLKDARRYGLLEELHTLPSVVYLTKVRNKEQNKNA